MSTQRINDFVRKISTGKGLSTKILLIYHKKLSVKSIKNLNLYLFEWVVEDLIHTNPDRIPIKIASRPEGPPIA